MAGELVTIVKTETGFRIYTGEAVGDSLGEPDAEQLSGWLRNRRFRKEQVSKIIQDANEKGSVQITLPLITDEDLDEAQYRKFVAIQFLNASGAILRGMKQLLGSNDFLALVSLRSFIEYTRRGVWLLFFAKPKALQNTRKLSFMESGTDIIAMDKRYNESLGLGSVSYLSLPVAGVNEPFINCLHALTHGNPIMARAVSVGLDTVFNTKMLVARAEMEHHIFVILLGRQLLGQDEATTWKLLAEINNKPNDVRANAAIVWHSLEKAGIENLLLNTDNNSAVKEDK